MKRLVMGFGAGLLASVGLFYLMSALIQSDGKFKRSSNEMASIEFLRQIKDSQADVRQRHKPKPPPEIEPQPEMPKMEITDNNNVSKPDLQMEMPQMSSALSKGNGPYLGGAGGSGGNSQALPVVRIEPQYPRRAAMKGQEGWVLLEFDITAVGTVDNVKVIESKPRRVFDSSARRALLKWKYKPKLIEGKAKKQVRQTVKLEFKLES